MSATGPASQPCVPTRYASEKYVCQCLRGREVETLAWTVVCYMNDHADWPKIKLPSPCWSTDMTTPIPSPPGLPFLGNLTAIETEVPLRSLNLLVKQYGEIYQLNIVGQGYQSSSVVVYS